MNSPKSRIGRILPLIVCQYDVPLNRFNNTRENTMTSAPKLIEKRFGTRLDIDDTYCRGGRSLRDVLELIVYYDLCGDPDQADYWRSELNRFPTFDERI